METDANKTSLDASSPRLDLSVIIPLYNEEENIDPAVKELLSVLDDMSASAEVILVDDGSRDTTGSKAMSWSENDDRIKVIQFRRNFGQTAAIAAGFEHAKGEVVVLMDGDQQNDPADIPKLLEKMAEGYDVVSGWRANRQDKLLMRKVPSKIANALISKITGTHLHDYGCTLKAYHADVVRHLRLYGELHRFIPALAAMSGAKVLEVPVSHRPRTRGSSKYGISRTFRVILDLITVKFLLSFLARPMQFFGRVGLWSLLLAAISGLFIPLQRAASFTLLKGQTWSMLAVLFIILTVQFICMGLLGELLTRIYHEGGMRKSYVVRHVVGFGAKRNALTDEDIIDIAAAETSTL